MLISQFTESQAIDMGIMDAAVRQAESHAKALEAHTAALTLNTQVVYLYGHGTRAYELTDVVMYDNGDFIYSVRPLSGGMEWSYDRRAFSTQPF